MLGIHIEMKRDNIPTINGSLSAFVAVVVFLSIVIVVACTAIFFVLRDHKALDEEQARQRGRSQNTPEPYISSSTPQNSYNTSWFRRLSTTLFRRTRGTSRSQITDRLKMRGRGAHGWIQAGSTDDWESDGGRGVTVNRAISAQETASSRSASPNSAVLQSGSLLPVSRSISDSTSSVRFDLHPVRGQLYPERYPSPHSALPNIHSQLSLSSHSSPPSPVPLRTLSPEPIATSDNESRQYLTPSGMVMRTLPGGTKFIEAL